MDPGPEGPLDRQDCSSSYAGTSRVKFAGSALGGHLSTRHVHPGAGRILGAHPVAGQTPTRADAAGRAAGGVPRQAASSAGSRAMSVKISHAPAPRNASAPLWPRPPGL